MGMLMGTETVASSEMPATAPLPGRLGQGAGLALAGCLGLLAMAGCGEGRKDAAEDKVIRVTRNIGGRAGFRKHFDAWKATFEKNNPGWTMQLIDLGNANGAEYYKTRIATGDLPEVVMTWQLTNFLADGGHLVPLPDSYYEKFGIPLPAPYKGKRYTSQGGVQIQGLAINRKMWADVGITEPPATWDDLVAGFQKLKAAGHKPLVYGGREWSAFQPLLYAIATNMYDYRPDPAQPSWTIRRNRGEVRFATDPTARMILGRMIFLLENFVDKGAASDGYNEEQRAFYGGKGATWMMGCWIGGDVEANKVDFDMDYWPIPSMTGPRPTFLMTSGIPSGWAITTSATGPKLPKAMAVLETFYDPQVFQLFLDGECQFGSAAKAGPTGPKSNWPPAQKLFDRMAARMKEYGTSPGCHLALDDMPPPILFDNTMKAVMQEIQAGTRDLDKLLKMLDDDWDSARRGM